MSEFTLEAILARVNLTLDQFKKEYWNQKPLFIKGAVPKESLAKIIDKETCEKAIQTNAPWLWTVSWDKSGEDLFFNQSEEKKGRVPVLTNLTGEQVSICRDLGAYVHIDNFFSHNQSAAEMATSLITDLKIFSKFYVGSIYQSDTVGIDGSRPGIVGKGYSNHSDPQDVFTLQLVGTKKWIVDQKRFVTAVEVCTIENKGYARTATADIIPWDVGSRGRETKEYLLEPGDLLYVPPYTLHETKSTGEYNICYNLLRARSTILSELDHFFSNVDPSLYYELAGTWPTPETADDAKDILVKRFERLLYWLKNIKSEEFVKIAAAVSDQGGMFLKPEDISVDESALDKEQIFVTNLLSCRVSISHINEDGEEIKSILLNGRQLEFDEEKWAPLFDYINRKQPFSGSDYLKNQNLNSDDWPTLRAYLKILCDLNLIKPYEESLDSQISPRKKSA